MKQQEAVVAKKYAKAFLNLFIDEISIKDYKQLVAFEQFWKAKQEAIAFLTLPHIELSAKCKVLDSIVDKFKLPACFKRLNDVLVEQRRAYLLPVILRYITMIYRQRKGILAFIIKSSRTLKCDELKLIEQFLAQKTEQQILSDHTVDTSLIAGIRMESDQYLWEYSVAKKLRALMMMSTCQ